MGKIFRRIEVPRHTNSVTQLSDGSIAIASRMRAANLLMELSSKGNTVWEAFTPNELCCVRVCLPLVRLGFDLARPRDLDFNTVAYRIQALRSPNAAVRRWSALALTEFGTKAEAAVPALIEALTDTDKNVRLAAGPALWRIGPAVIPQLVNLLKHRDPQVRAWVIQVIYRCWPDGKAALPHLLEILKDEDAGVRQSALSCIAEMAQHDKGVLAPIISALKDRDENVRKDAAFALLVMGPKAKDGIPALLQALKGKDRTLRYWAALALGKIGAEEETVVPALIRTLKDRENPLACCGAAEALAYFGRKGKAAMPALMEAIKRQDLSALPVTRAMRANSIFALGEMGPEARDAVPLLTGILKDKNEDLDTRRAAAQSLGRIGHDTQTVAPVLLEILKQKPSGVLASRRDRKDLCLRDTAGEALVNIYLTNKDAVALLAKVVADRTLDVNVRCKAAAALGKMASAAKAAIPALEHPAYESSQVAKSAEQALKQITGEN